MRPLSPTTYHLPPAAPAAAPPPPRGGDESWATTFAFWAALLVAGVLFAAVSLAPKLRLLAELDADYAANQRRLVELERQAIELERVAEALEHDPAFAAELAKLEFAAGPAGEDRIAVAPPLRLGADAPATDIPIPASRRPIPPRLLAPLASDPVVRTALLATAALLTTAAFTLLNDAQTAAARRLMTSSQETTRRLTNRYRKAA